MRIAIDIGGVISKYPQIFKNLIETWRGHDIFIITDMHDKNEIIDLLKLNEVDVDADKVLPADYKTHGEMCKAILCYSNKIDVLIDDFMGYLEWDSRWGLAPVRLLVMPDAFRPYWATDWKTRDELDFGRRCFKRG